jgi:hypothetical protein
VDKDHPQARAAYASLRSRIVELQGTLAAGEFIDLRVDGVPIKEIAIRGNLIWFYGKTEVGQQIVIGQHYSQTKAVLVRRMLQKGEKPKEIGFLSK